MRASGSTVLVVVGDERERVLRGLDPLPNVRARSLGADDSLGDFLARGQTTYLMHDRDPLEHVATAWAEFFEDRSTLGTLDAEIEAAQRDLAMANHALPDYYLVLDPESLPELAKHWWLGVVSHVSPLRVLPTPSDLGSVRRMLRTLPAGRAWPPVAEWLPRVRFQLPDRVGLN